MKHLTLFAATLFLCATGCSSTEPLEERIRELNWQLDSAEQATEQANVDKRLAQRELEIAKGDARANKEKLALAYDALREARTKLDERLQERLSQLSQAQDGGEKLEISQYGGIVLKGEVFFRPGRHELTSAGQKALQPLVSKLQEEQYASYEIEVAGHSDSDPIRRTKSRYRDNWDLAAMRANSVRRYLIEKGIENERLFTSSWGFLHPIEAGNKSRNRRVEIMLRKKTEAVPASAKKADAQ